MIATRSKTNQIHEQQEPLLYSDTSYIQLADFPEVPKNYPSSKEYSSNKTEESEAFLQHNFSSPIIDVEREPPTVRLDVDRQQNYVHTLNDDFFEQEFKLNVKDENLVLDQAKSFQSTYSVPPLPQQLQLPQQFETVAPNIDNDYHFDLSMLSFQEQINLALQFSMDESQTKIQPEAPQYIANAQERKQYYDSSVEASQYYANLQPHEISRENVPAPVRVQVSSNPLVDALSDIPMTDSLQNHNSLYSSQQPGVAYVYPTEDSNAKIVQCSYCEQWLKVIKQATIVHCPTCSHRTSIVEPPNRAQSGSVFSCFSKLFSS